MSLSLIRLENIIEQISTVQLVLYIIFIVLIVGAVIIVISENSNPIRTLAWILVLLFLPGIGLAFYYFFGRDNRKAKQLSTKYKSKVKLLSFNSVMVDESVQVLPEYKTLVRLLEYSNNASVLKGSEVEVITTGERKFSALMDDLNNARHHIHMEYFIFYNDETGKMVKELLMRKASEGVKVRFLYDNVANWFVPAKFYNEMKQSGVEVSPFTKVILPALHSKVNYRNHRKVVVIDGHIGYIGGMNIANEYYKDLNWRDTHLRIAGKGVYGLQANFLIDWYFAVGETVEDRKCFPPCEIKTNNLMQVAAGGPVSTYRNLMLATANIIVTAKKYLYIQTPYFLPTEALVHALESAALGGVDVRLMVSAQSDSPYVDPAARSYYGDLLRAGLRIYELQGKFIHAKTIVADDYISVIGSANMDFRSFESNFEINCYLYDSELALRNKEIFLEDLKQCRELNYQEWLERPWWKRFFESLMRLFAPLM